MNDQDDTDKQIPEEAKKPQPTVTRKTKPLPTVEIDYRKGRVPDWVKDAIETHLLIDAENARSAGTVGYMTRALVIATMPYKDPKTVDFKRVNGDFSLRMVAGYEGGLPFGIYPRLLMSWVATEAVRTNSPVIELGDSLSMFLRDVLELRRSGGERGTSSRVAEQMKRLFGSLITAQYTGKLQERGFRLRNVLIADDMELYDSDINLDPPSDTPDAEHQDSPLWLPQNAEHVGKWKSHVRLSNNFFRECIEKPVPIDLRAYKALRGSPLAMDVYTWLTYRMSYTHKKTHPIPWEALMGQFGSSFESASAVRDFKKAFIKALKAVQVVYPEVNVQVENNGLVLLPSPTHVPSLQGQQNLF